MQPTPISRSASRTPLTPSRSYVVDSWLDAFVDAAVEGCLRRRDSLDETVDIVAALIRTTAPNDVAQTDPEWEPRWRAYFEFYDHAVMHAIRAYVERECN